MDSRIKTNAALKEISSWPVRAAEFLERTEHDDELVDVLGQLNSVTTALGQVKRHHASEVAPDTLGQQWALEIGRQAKRSYNTGGLFLKFMDAWSTSLVDTMIRLIREDILRVSWQWTKLTAAAADAGFELRRVPHAIDEGDAFDIGEVWGDGSPRYVAVNNE
jgi:hypothetical protein